MQCTKIFNVSYILLLFLFIFPSGCSNGQEETGTKKGSPEFSILYGYPNDDYPKQGTILGNWIEKKTGTTVRWEFTQGDMSQKITLLMLDTDYPDVICGEDEIRNHLFDGVFIPLNDLIEKYGNNVRKFYKDRIKLCYEDSGKMYLFPRVFPSGDEVSRVFETHGLYIQKAVLKEFGYPLPGNLSEAFDMLVAYAKGHPTINGYKTVAYSAFAGNNLDYRLMNAPLIFSGHPNDAYAAVDRVNGKWIAHQFYDKEDAYKIYKLYNRLYLEDLYDIESFVMNFDQYLEKLATGSILAFYDLHSQVSEIQRLLKQRGQDRWYVPLPVVMEGYEEEFEAPPRYQVSGGLGITSKCKDPVRVFRYIDFLCSEEAQIARQWGFKGDDYLVDKNGYFYRTEEQIKKWSNLRWLNRVFGRSYWINIAGFSPDSVYSDGKNAVSPDNQPSVFKEGLLDTEREVLNAYSKATWYDFFKKPDPERASYYPMWTVRIPAGSDVQIANEKIMQVRRKYTPLLIMAGKGKYDDVWNEYIKEINKIPHRNKYAQFFQDQLDLRVQRAGE